MARAGELDHRPVQRLHLRRLFLGERVRPHARHQMGLGLLQPEQDDALDAEHDQLHVALARPRHLLDDRLGADVVEVIGLGLILGGVALRDDHQFLAFGGESRFRGRPGRRPAHRKRHQQMRKQNAVFQRQSR